MAKPEAPHVHGVIRTKLHIKHHDNLPYTGWAGWRNQIPEMFQELGFDKGAEIGVGDGAFSEIICREVQNVELLCVDSYEVGPDYANEAAASQALATAEKRLSQFNAKIMHMRSIEAARQIPDNSLDFVYIDGARDFDTFMQDLIYWSPKVRSGGIVSGRNYAHSPTEAGNGVIYAIEAYVRGWYINPWYLAHRDFHNPSWLWVR